MFRETGLHRFAGVGVPAELFYLQCHDTAPASLPFVAGSFPLTSSSLPFADERLAAVIKTYGQPDTTLSDGGRLIHALRFREEKTLFENALRGFAKDAHKPSVHIVARADLASDSAVLSEVAHLAIRLSNVRIHVYLIYPQSFTPIKAAGFFATLNELDLLPGIIIQHFAYRDRPDEVIREVSLQMFQAACSVSMTVGVAGKGETFPPIHSFLHVRTLTFLIDRNQIQLDLARRLTGKLMTRVLTEASPDESRDPPEWIDELFEDPQWLLDFDCLTKSRNIDNDERYSLINVEWDKYMNSARRGIDNDDPWTKQIDDIEHALDDAYRYSFRRVGVDRFYACDDEALKPISERIVKQLEQRLVLLWGEEQASPARLNAVIDFIVAALDQTLNSRYYSDLTRRRRTADDKKFACNNLKLQIQNADRRDLRRLREEYPPERAAEIMSAYRAAMCHVKSSTYACALLRDVMNRLEDLKQNIAELPAAIERESQVWMKDSQRMRMRLLSGKLDRHRIYAVFGHDPLSERFVPDDFPVAQVRRKIWQMCVAEAPVKSFDGFAAYWRQSGIDHRLTQEIMLRYPPVTPKYEQNVLWHLMYRVLNRNTAEFTRAIHESIPKHEETHGVWILPLSPADVDIPAFVNILNSITPGRRVLINTVMSIPMMIYRSIDTEATADLPGFADMSEAYNQLVYRSPQGAIHSMLLHTRNLLPFPELPFGASMPLPSLDHIRDCLLRGELMGLVIETSSQNRPVIALSLEQTTLPLAGDFQQALSDINPNRFGILRQAVDSGSIAKSPEEVRRILDERLNKLRKICLGGKTDLKKATWEEAGRYMPWARAADKIITQVKNQVAADRTATS